MVKLPQRINKILAKWGISETELFVGTKKQWIVSILIILSPLIVLAGILIIIGIKFWPVVLDKIL